MASAAQRESDFTLGVARRLLERAVVWAGAAAKLYEPITLHSGSKPKSSFQVS